ncbi:MAG TPA: PilZ domain-containing protein [Gaiellaceae bacterium]
MPRTRDERFARRVPAEITVACCIRGPGGEERETFVAETFDVSARGLGLRVERAAKMGTMLTLAARSDDPPLELAAAGKVVRMRRSRGWYLWGVQLVPDLEQQARLTRFVLAWLQRSPAEAADAVENASPERETEAGP